MHPFKLRHKFFIHRFKIALLLLMTMGIKTSFAQFNAYGHDVRYEAHNWHFGISLGINFSNYKITLDSNYFEQQEILEAHPVTNPGFGLGILASYHLSKYFEIRFVPDLAFADRSIKYTLSTADSTPLKTIESVYLEFPFNLKYRSKSYKDFRMYVQAGFKYSIDMQSNASARLAENLIKVYKNDFALEYGVGMEFHLPLVTISPEIKVSYGLQNVLKPDDNLIYSKVLDGLRSRSILFAIHFEG